MGAVETGGDIVGALSDIRPLHPKNNTFPGEIFMRLAADALEEGGVGAERPISEEDLVGRYLPECEFRGRDNRKIRYAIMAAAATHGGVRVDLLDEVVYWTTDDFWSYSALAAIAWIRAVADQRAITLAALCGRLRVRADSDRPGQASSRRADAPRGDGAGSRSRRSPRCAPSSTSS